MQRANANLATVVAEHTKRTLLDLDQVANLAKAHYAELGPKFDPDRFVREVGFDGNFVLAMIIADEQGQRATASGGMPRNSFADRPYFQRHRDEKLGRSIVSAPVFGRVKSRWVLPVSWRLDKPDGSFGGIIAMGVNPYHFTDLYRRIDLGKRAIVALVGSDGIVRARLSDNETTFGQNLAGAPTLAISMRDGHGSLIHEARVDGVKRVYSFKRIDGFPLHVIVGSALDSVLETSRAERRKGYQYATGASVGILATSLLLFVFKRRQRRADRALEIAQSRQRAIFNSIADPAWLKDAEGRFVAVNRAFERMFGLPAAQIVGTMQPELLVRSSMGAPTDCPSVADSLCDGQRCELQLLRDGQDIWLETATAAIVSSGGGISGTAGTARDITARKHLERDLKESRDRLELALRHASMAVWEWEPASDRLVHTDGLARLLGHADDHCIASHSQWFDRVHVQDRRALEEALRRCLDHALEFNVEYRVCGIEGAVRWVHDRGAATATSPDGRARVVCGIAQDISVRKAAELAQRESEQRFRVLVETMEDIFWIASPGLEQVHYLSPAFHRTLGLEVGLLYADPGRWRELVHPEDLDIAQDFIAQQLRSEPAQCELRMQPAQGACRWMLVRSVPWRDARGAPLVAGVVEDVTERKQASERRVHDAERQRDALVMEVHHRIKNNLQGVLGLLDEHKHADASTRALLRNLATRIQSVATVHGLQGRRAGSVIVLDELVRAIVDNAVGLGDARVDLHLDHTLGEVPVKERESVPVALILNELVWNAIKHSVDVPHRAQVVMRNGVNNAVEIAVWNRGALATGSEAKGLTDGNGLGLVSALMPPKGATLSHAASEGGVVATLMLSVPVLEFQRLHSAA